MTVRYGVVGCSGVGTTHMEAVEHADGAELAAVCDLDPSIAAEYADEYDVEAFTDATAMIEADVDAVSVCTPSGTHADVTIECARAGAAVLCEKPLEVKLDRLNRMLAVVEEEGVTFGGVYQRRTFPHVRFAKHAIDSGTLGEVLSLGLDVGWFRSQSYYDQAEWRGTRDLDGGVLMNQAPHHVDWLQWLLDDAESVFAHCATRARDIESEDTASLLVRFESGAVATLRATTAGVGNRSGLEVTGTEGTVAFDQHGLDRYEIADPESEPEHMRQATITPEVDLEAHAFEHGEGHAGVVQDFVRAIEEGRDPMVPASEARTAIDINLAAYRSSETGAEVQIADLH